MLANALLDMTSFLPDTLVEALPIYYFTRGQHCHQWLHSTRDSIPLSPQHPQNSTCMSKCRPYDISPSVCTEGP